MRGRILAVLLLLVSLGACTSFGRNYEFATMSPRDFNGTWVGSVKCSFAGNPHSKFVTVIIDNGRSTLRNFAGYNPANSVINGRGIVRWEGTYPSPNYKVRERPWYAVGYWDRDNFHIWADRGPRVCSGTLKIASHTTPGLKPGGFWFGSYDPGDYGPVYRGDWKLDQGDRWALMPFGPEEGERPLVVLMHGLQGPEGAKHFFHTTPRLIADAGGVALVVRHESSTGIPGRVVDTFLAVRKAVQDPRVDPKRVYLVGLGDGGLQALHMISRRIHDELNPGTFKIAGMVLAYPNCRTRFEETEVLRVPTLFLTGALDREAPPGFCDTFIREANSEAFMKRIEFPDAGHDWMFSRPLKVVTESSWGACGRQFIDREGYWHSADKTISSKFYGYYDYIDKAGAACKRPVRKAFGRVDEAYGKTMEYILAMINGRPEDCFTDMAQLHPRLIDNWIDAEMDLRPRVIDAGLGELMRNRRMDSVESPEGIVRGIYAAMRKAERGTDCFF